MKETETQKAAEIPQEVKDEISELYVQVKSSDYKSVEDFEIACAARQELRFAAEFGYQLGRSKPLEDVEQLKKEWFDAGLATNKILLDDYREQLDKISKVFPKDFHPDISIPAKVMNLWQYYEADENKIKSLEEKEKEILVLRKMNVKVIEEREGLKSRERELEEALRLAYEWAEFTGVQSLEIFSKAKQLLNNH